MMPKPAYVREAFAENKADDLLKKQQKAFVEHQQKVEFEMHQFWKPHKGQAPVAYALFRQLKRYVFMQCGRKLGKALALDTPILTPNGFVPIGELKEGDTVYDEKGREQKILIAHDVIDSPESYRLHFCNGTFIDACADHQWLTYTKLDRKSIRRFGDRGRKPTVKSTKDIYETQMHGKEYNHSIPYSDPVNMNKRDLPLDPYLLGAWLGDGNTYRAGFSTEDWELLAEFEAKGFPVSHYSGCDYGIRGNFVTRLKELGVIRNKHIPEDYLRGSIDQRLAMVQGLMDTDGWISDRGEVAEFYSVLPELAEGMEFLLSSLGMKPIRKIKKTTHKDCHIVRFKPLMEVFRLERKKSRLRFDTSKSLHHTIKKVEKIKSKPMRCLTVSGESKLFLAGKNLIPTHNTDLAIYCMYLYAMLFPGSQIYYIADTMKHAGELVWKNGRLQRFFLSAKRLPSETQEEYNFRRKVGKALHDKWILKANESEMRVTFTNGSFIKVDGAENYANADGIEPDFIVYDEFKHHDPRYNEAMEPNLRVKRAPLLIVGTPPEELGTYYEKIANSTKRASYGFFCRRPSYLNPVIYPLGEQDPDFLEECEKYDRRGEEDVKRRELYAEIVLSGSKAIFPVIDLPKYDYEKEKYIGTSRHVRPTEELLGEVNARIKDWEFFVCFDPASTSTFAVLFCALNKYDKRVFILDEIYEQDQREMTTRKIVERAIVKWRAIYGYDDAWEKGYDNAAAWFENEVYDIFEDIGLTPCEKDIGSRGEDKREAKLSLIKDMYIHDKIQIADRCVKFLWETVNYRKDDKGKIPKENDHLIDNFRYILNAMMYSPEDVRVPVKKVTDRRGFRPENEYYDNLPSEEIAGLIGVEMYE